MRSETCVQIYWKVNFYLLASKSTSANQNILLFQIGQATYSFSAASTLNRDIVDSFKHGPTIDIVDSKHTEQLFTHEKLLTVDIQRNYLRQEYILLTFETWSNDIHSWLIDHESTDLKKSTGWLDSELRRSDTNDLIISSAFDSTVDSSSTIPFSSHVFELKASHPCLL